MIINLLTYCRITNKMDTIFVSVASYRDDECPATLEYLFGKADNPHNVYIGICQQNDSDNGDIDCVFENAKYDIFKNNIRMIRLKHHEAKGPTWARYLCSTLYNNETYFFQIDSHTKLVDGWDTKCINMMKYLKSTGMSNKPELSHYPAAWESFSEEASNRRVGVTRICKSFFNERGMISFLGAETINTNEMFPSPYVAGGFLFSEGSMLKDVPFDPTLDFLFVGEEILHSIRIWTAGYDIFTPNENIAFHEYTRAEKPKIWTDKKYTDEEAFEKVKVLIGLVDNNDLSNYKYGLGKKRSLKDYYKFAGIDLENKKVSKNFCRPGLKDPDAESIEHFGNVSYDNRCIYMHTNLILHILIIIMAIFFLYKMCFLCKNKV